MPSTTPTKHKTWEIDPNLGPSSTASQLANDRTVWHAIKNSLIGGAFTSPWEVVGSSDSSTAALDAVDRLSASTNWVWADYNTAKSWIVLEQPALDGCQWLLECRSGTASSTHFSMYVSPRAGFAIVGTATIDRPHASDEMCIIDSSSNEPWGESVNNLRRVHVWGSDDGEAWYIAVTKDKVPTSFGFIMRPRSPKLGYGHPNIVAGWHRSGVVTTSCARFADWNAGTSRCDVYANGQRGTALISAPMAVNAALGSRTAGQKVGDVSTKAQFYDATFRSVQAGMSGKIGYPWDMYWGHAAMAAGDRFDSTGGLYEWISLGAGLILPWNGGATFSNS